MSILILVTSYSEYAIDPRNTVMFSNLNFNIKIETLFILSELKDKNHYHCRSFWTCHISVLHVMCRCSKWILQNSYPKRQCAAVSTHSGSINEPPQRDFLLEVILTCQGNWPGTALTPETICSLGISIAAAVKKIALKNNDALLSIAQNICAKYKNLTLKK